MKQIYFRLLYTTCLLFICTISVNAQGFQLQWANVFAGTAPVTVGRIASDKGGNVYVSGSFAGTVDFEPGTNTTNLTADTAFGKGTNFLAKYNLAGSLVYVRQLGAGINAIRLDNSDNICITGLFSSTEDFDPGTGTAPLTSPGSSCMYISRYDAGGNYINAFAIGSGTSRDVNAITTDPSGNLYITGHFGGTIDFDPGAGTNNLVSNGADDIYLAKYSPAGALLFAFRLNGSSTGTEEGVALAADATGVYLGGRVNGTLDLDPGTGTVSVTSNGADGFVAKYDPSGAFLFGNNYDGNVYGLIQDGSSNIWVTGSIADSMDADLGPGRAMLYGANNFDVYLVKYSSSGAYLQGRAFQSNSNYNPEEGIAVNHKNSVYIYGQFKDTVDFNPGGSVGKFISSGLLDGYVMKYDASNSFVAGFSMGTPTGNERIRGMTVDHLGRIWVSGNFTGTIDLDPGTGITNLTSTPSSGGYLARYSDGETDASAGVNNASVQNHVNVYGTNNTVFVDFTALSKVDAQVKVFNLLGQTVADTRHFRNDMLKLDLPDAAPQIYVVTVSTGGIVTAKKVWVE